MYMFVHVCIYTCLQAYMLLGEIDNKKQAYFVIYNMTCAYQVPYRKIKHGKETE